MLVPYQEGAEIIRQLEDAISRLDFTRTRGLLEKAKPYTVAVPEAQIQRMLQNGIVAFAANGGSGSMTQQTFT